MDDSSTSQDSNHEDPADIFFKLANVSMVGFRLDHRDKSILVHQHTSAQSHTGGIVWEASYLLAYYLYLKYKDSTSLKSKPLGKLLEVGSGCGMLGLVLAAFNLCNLAVLTETTAVIDNLHRNVCLNIQRGIVSADQICSLSLRWDRYKEDISENKQILTPHSFDTIVGTDVIFSIAFVKPLLKTLRKLSHTTSTILLCVPIRCEDAYNLFLLKAHHYDLDYTDITQELYDLCPWGSSLECKLLQLTKTNASSALLSIHTSHVTIENRNGHGRKKRQRVRSNDKDPLANCT